MLLLRSVARRDDKAQNDLSSKHIKFEMFCLNGIQLNDIWDYV